MLDNMRRLHPRGAANRGICVDADGAMLGPDCVLVGRTPRGFRAIERDAAASLQKCPLGIHDDPNWLFDRCQHIADLLDKGELALAQIYGLHIPIRDLDDRQLRRIAHVGLTKAGFNPDEPRIPKGDHRAGEWTDGGTSSADTEPSILEIGCCMVVSSNIFSPVTSIATGWRIWQTLERLPKSGSQRC